MKNLLIVSVSAPPKLGPESMQVRRYIKYLKEYYDITLLTTAPARAGWMKAELINLSMQEVEVVNIKGFYNRYLRYIISKFFKRLLHRPDYDFPFPLQWRRAVNKTKKPDLIYSRSQPYSSAMMARKLSIYYEVPWVMHLSDPWVGNPYLKSSDWQKKEERKCIEVASKVSVTTESALKYYKERYPQFNGKFIITPNVYDPEEVTYSHINLSGKLTFVYAGNLYADRNPAFLLKALSQIHLESPHLMENIEFIFVGFSDRQSNKLILENQFLNVKKIDFLPYEQTRVLLRKAQVLLTIDKPAEQTEDLLFLPSKIQDYMALNKFILAITNENSPTAKIIGADYGLVSTYSSLSNLKQNLIQIIEAYKRKDHDFFRTKAPKKEFSAKYNAGQLKNIFNKL